MALTLKMLDNLLVHYKFFGMQCVTSLSKVQVRWQMPTDTFGGLEVPDIDLMKPGM